MRGIVADTTPLNYLILIEAASILPQLYGTVLIPPAVCAELIHPKTPARVRAWVAQPPSWLQTITLRLPIDPVLLCLDLGEREAIALACEQQAELLLIDERDGASVARERGLAVTGTLAALDLAAARGWVDLKVMFERLRDTTFRTPMRLMASMLERDAQRKRR